MTNSHLENTQPLRALQQDTAVMEDKLEHVVRDIDKLTTAVNEIANGVNSLRVISERHAQSLERLFNDLKEWSVEVSGRIDKLEHRIALAESTLDRHKWPVGLVMAFVIAALGTLLVYVWETVKAAVKIVH